MVALKRIWTLPLMLLLLAVGCLDPYQPPTSTVDTDLLVIDGLINATDNVATVKISRAIGLSEATPYPLEANANVSIEEEGGNSMTLAEGPSGLYSVDQVFEMTKRYRLKVVTDGKEYLSSFITLQKNTEIDSLDWNADDKKFTISVNSHDFSNGQKYYRYTYDETYEYTASLFSAYKLVDGKALYRLPEEYVYWCWITQASKPILLASTENLNSNVVAHFPVINISKGDRRLWKKYSALVRQISLDRDAYEFWSQLKKITESLGSLFDPLPYQIKGNLTSKSDPDEPVLGYFSGGEVTSKRIVVSNNDMPDGYYGFPARCQEENVKIALLHTLDPSISILTEAETVGIFVVGYFYSSPQCTDCRLEGGTNVKPDFLK
jgi:Domain of unknown function (DUF4249)